MLKFMRQILRGDTGATAVEYGLIVSLIVIAMITALQSVATQNTAMWDFVQEEVTTP
jgi:pilus assembly protein Flp/PilA